MFLGGHSETKQRSRSALCDELSPSQSHFQPAKSDGRQGQEEQEEKEEKKKACPAEEEKRDRGSGRGSRFECDATILLICCSSPALMGENKEKSLYQMAPLLRRKMKR